MNNFKKPYEFISSKKEIVKFLNKEKKNKGLGSDIYFYAYKKDKKHKLVYVFKGDGYNGGHLIKKKGGAE